MKSVCSKCHISGLLKNIQKQYNIQPQLLKGEVYHSLINFGIYENHEYLWRPYLIGAILGPAYVAARHGDNIQKI